MIALLGITVVTSALDSLNPAAIAQQFVLQAAVEKKRWIWWFILGVGLTNFVSGILVYYGIAAMIETVLSFALESWPVQIRSLQLFIAALCLAFGIRQIIKIARTQRKTDDAAASKEIKTVLRPASLFALGIAFCGVELSSALPYFGFLAVLTGYHLDAGSLLGILLLYNIIYSLPLILIYFAYSWLQSSGSRVLKKIEAVMSVVSDYLLPAVITLVGAFLTVNGITSLLR